MLNPVLCPTAEGGRILHQLYDDPVDTVRFYSHTTEQVKPIEAAQRQATRTAKNDHNCHGGVTVISSELILQTYSLPYKDSETDTC